MYNILRQVSVVLVLATTAYGAVTSISGTFDILSPLPNSIYVAGQILPVVYSFSSSIAASQTLQLAVSIIPNASNQLNVTNFVVTANADVSQSGKLSKGRDNLSFYEKAINFPIPKDVPAGIYDVIFTDKLQQTNTVITVKINPQAPNITTSNLFSPTSGGGNSVNGESVAQPSSFLSSSDGQHLAPGLLAVCGAMLVSLLAL
ncbi:hypothetical protein K450DRAFT_278842 [Umbelopsis ramanniana AG]|uniref:Uncharacterized protein n=1 Tax=Umbelopsis ramanniana AG TaxID=1314678 RepID=A0AAD5EE15_UMBRA|nr:uncharacterized protein K450DRAFT_278842 [Umbelopsis ramanniana AG]KAI8581769.1 hypothetical protein K450DRAFT_278842 [Umbelopsis ramanniana AG]